MHDLYNQGIIVHSCNVHVRLCHCVRNSIVKIFFKYLSPLDNYVSSLPVNIYPSKYSCKTVDEVHPFSSEKYAIAIETVRARV